MSDLTPWLRLVHTSGIGPALTQKLLHGFGSIHEIYRASDAKLAACGLPQTIIRALNSVDEQRIENDLEWLNGGDDRTILPYDSARYPALLKEIPDPPIVLYARGDCDILQTPQLAVVGSRKPSLRAEQHTTSICTEIAGYGITITSGLALGIDGCAHQSALAADGLTVAVTATGLDRVYPARHQSLAHQIAANGVIVSEFPIGTNPLPRNFPRRNRIISGLAYGTLVIEAAQKSGTLTTAAHATDQGREVFAIPGPIDHPQTRGSNALLKSGATLIENATDILQQLAPALPGSLEVAATDDLTPAYDHDIPTSDTPTGRLLRAISHEALSMDDIVEATGLDIITVTNLTLDLQLQGSIAADTAGRYLKVPVKK